MTDVTRCDQTPRPPLSHLTFSYSPNDVVKGLGLMAQPEQGGAMLARPKVAKLLTFQFWGLQLLSEVPQSLDGEMGTIMGGRHSARHTIT